MSVNTNGIFITHLTSLWKATSRLTRSSSKHSFWCSWHYTIYCFFPKSTLSFSLPARSFSVYSLNVEIFLSVPFYCLPLFCFFLCSYWFSFTYAYNSQRHIFSLSFLSFYLLICITKILLEILLGWLKNI